MSDTNRLNDDDDEDENEKHWYYPRTSSPHSSLSVNNSFTHQTSSATMGSWGFDVNRSTNGQTPPSSFTTNNNSNRQRPIIARAAEDYNERQIDIPSSSLQLSKLRSPTLTKQRDGNEFAAIDRLALGVNRSSHGSSQQLSMSSKHQPKVQTEQELLAWQNRMLQRDQRMDTASPKPTTSHNGTNSVPSSSRQTSTVNRRIPAMLNTNENQYPDHDYHESTIKSARVIKRYIELVYHLQSFYERITDQLSSGSSFVKANRSLFALHCRKMTDQLQQLKPVWEGKLADLQHHLRDISSSHSSTDASQITFLKRRLTLIKLLQILSNEEELDITDLSIRTDVGRVLHEDQLAVQLQDELSTLLQHQALLNDFTSLLQWNSPIYSSSEQSRAEDLLPVFREQMATTDSYLTHVSQQLIELVTNLRSSEKYILSYTNSIPLIEDELAPPQPSLSSSHEHWSRYDKANADATTTKEPRTQQFPRKERINDNSSKTRSVSVPRHAHSEESIHSFDRDDLRLPAKKNSMSFNTNNSNNNGVSTRFAAVKSVRRDTKTQPNVKSILKSHSHVHSSNGGRREYDIDAETFSANEVDAFERVMDLDDRDPVLASSERTGMMRNKGDARKMLSKQSLQEMNSTDDDTRSSFDRKGLSKARERALNLQSMLAVGAKEKSRQVAVKHHFNRSYQQQLTNPNY